MTQEIAQTLLFPFVTLWINQETIFLFVRIHIQENLNKPFCASLSSLIVTSESGVPVSGAATPYRNEYQPVDGQSEMNESRNLALAPT